MRRGLKDLHVQVDVAPRFVEVVGPCVSPHTVEGIPLVGLTPPSLSRSPRFLERTMDVVLSALGLVVRRGSRGPALFRQVRMGAGGWTFEILELRTTVSDAVLRTVPLVWRAGSA